MLLEHEFVVPVPVAQAWDVLLDVERIAPCMPGASVDSFDGETVHGKVKVRVGPIQVTYAGQAHFVEKHEDERRIVLDAHGKEARGAGTAAAKIESRLYDEGGSTRVTVTTDLAITGKPAQFGRGVMVEVGSKLIGQFADCLAQEITGPPPPPLAVAAPPAAGEVPPVAAEAPTAGPPPAQAVPQPTVPRREAEPIDLLGAAGVPVLKRLVPLVVAVIAVVLLWRFLRRRA